MNYNPFKSRTIWTIIVMFLVGGIQSISSFLPNGVEVVLLGILSLGAAYFHLDTAIKSGATN